jgi:hypothetical protein
MKTPTRNAERGVALFFSIFALLLLTAIGATLVFMANTETSINSNFRQEQVAYFGAKAGIEEARARMMASDPNTMFGVGQASLTCPNLNPPNPLFDQCQIAAPGTSAVPMVYYIVNPGAGPAVQPWNAGNAFADDELCHDGYLNLGLVAEPPDVRCPVAALTTTTAPTGAALTYNTTSALPFSGTAGALPFKWVRISPKVNNSISYLQSAPGAPIATAAPYSVNPNPFVVVNATNVAIGPATLICWDGQEEVPLTITAGPPAITKCSDLVAQAGPSAGAPMTNVYLLTAMGVSSTTQNAARKMLQADVALQPMEPLKYGLYGTSTACPAITFLGNNASTDSYTTANGGTYATTKTNTGGDVGSNGGVNIGNGNIGGIIGVLQPPPAGNGNCPNPYQTGPNGTSLGTPACPSGNAAQCYMPAPYQFPTPPAPNPLPPNTPYTPPNCGAKKAGGQCMVGGTYGNITVNGTLYLAPGVYNLNSLSMAGNGQIIASPPGAVTINIAGTGQATPLTIAGNGITDDTIPNDFVINYAGTGTISVTGNGDVTAQLDAPNAPIVQKGNGNWYGSIVCSTASIGGNAFFHYDRNAALAPNNNGYFSMVSYREVPY